MTSWSLIFRAVAVGTLIGFSCTGIGLAKAVAPEKVKASSKAVMPEAAPALPHAYSAAKAQLNVQVLSEKEQPVKSVLSKVIKRVREFITYSKGVKGDPKTGYIKRENRFHSPKHRRDEPGPTPEPEPAPLPEPAPEPVPAPEPAPEPVPAPSPSPSPEPTPTPNVVLDLTGSDWVITNKLWGTPDTWYVYYSNLNSGYDYVLAVYDGSTGQPTRVQGYKTVESTTMPDLSGAAFVLTSSVQSGGYLDRYTASQSGAAGTTQMIIDVYYDTQGRYVKTITKYTQTFSLDQVSVPPLT